MDYDVKILDDKIRAMFPDSLQTVNYSGPMLMYGIGRPKIYLGNHTHRKIDYEDVNQIVWVISHEHLHFLLLKVLGDACQQLDYIEEKFYKENDVLVSTGGKR